MRSAIRTTDLAQECYDSQALVRRKARSVRGGDRLLAGMATRLYGNGWLMAGKNKGGREARKPKQEHSKSVKGPTASPVSQAVDAPRANRPRGKS